MADFINTVDVIGDDALTDSIIDKSITEYKDNSVKKIGAYAFIGCTGLTTVNLPAATIVSQYAFQDCKGLTTVNLPAVTASGNGAFYKCKGLTTVNLPAATAINDFVFYNCTGLTTVNLPAAIRLQKGAFSGCEKLTTLILRAGSMCNLYDTTTVLKGTPIASGTGYIYVPAALIDTYKAATNWSTFAAQFRALEDYTVDGTTTGELDPTKI